MQIDIQISTAEQGCTVYLNNSKLALKNKSIKTNKTLGYNMVQGIFYVRHEDITTPTPDNI